MDILPHKLGFCLGWKGQLICLEGGEGGGGEGGRGGREGREGREEGEGRRGDCYTYSNRNVQ